MFQNWIISSEKRQILTISITTRHVGLIFQKNIFYFERSNTDQCSTTLERENITRKNPAAVLYPNRSAVGRTVGTTARWPC